MRLAEAAALARELARRFAFPPGAVARVAVVGSVRRGLSAAPGGKPAAVGDIDLLVVLRPGREPAGVLGAAALRPRRRGDRIDAAATPVGGPAGDRHRAVRLAVRGRRPVRADLFAARAAEAPYALFHYTGPRAYNIRTRAHAKRRGWRLNQYGLADAATGRPVRAARGVRSERDLAVVLGLTWRPPGARG